MSERNGTARNALRDLRAENDLRREKIRAARLARAEKRATRLMESLSIDWVTPYAELLNLVRREGDPVIAGPTSAWQRRQGRNWPIYQTEQELNLLRAPARVLLATVSYAQGLVEGLTSYVLGSGCTYRVARADDQDDLPDDLVDAAQDVVDRVLERNQWYGGEQPGIEEELFGRSIEDGEFILCHYPREDGWTEFRVREPEHLTQPPGSDFAEYGFGIQTPPDDAQTIRRYYLQHGDTPSEGEEYDPDEVTHFRRNVRRAMKRGITDFSFDTYDALHLAGKLRTHLGTSGAAQAAIIGVRQHRVGSQSDIQSFVDGDADHTETEYLTGEQRPVKISRSGWEDISEGLEYVDGPGPNNAPAHIQILDTCLRGAGQKWQAPPWIMSGDLNAMNYATSLTAESPFVRTVLRRQRGYCEAFRRPVWFALRHYAQTRGLRDRTGKVWSWEEIEHRLKLQVTAPSPETRNKMEEAQRAQIEIGLGVQSRQAYMQEQGRNPDQVEADNQAYQEKSGDQQPGVSDEEQDPSASGEQGELRGTVGGLQAIANLQQQFYAGQIPQAAAIAVLVSVFGFGEEEAAGMFPPVEAVKRTDDTGQDSDGPLMGDEFDQLAESLLESEDADVQTELVEADAPAGKVWKVITVNRGGKTFQSKRLVNATTPKTPKEKSTKGATEKKSDRPAKADPATVAKEVHAALADPAKITPDAVKSLTEKLKGLTIPQIQAIQKERGASGGKDKAARIQKLIDHARAKTSGNRPSPPVTPHDQARAALDAMGLAHDHLSDEQAAELHSHIKALHAKTLKRDGEPPKETPRPSEVSVGDTQEKPTETPKEKPVAKAAPKTADRATVPTGHEVVHDLGDGVVTSRDPKTGSYYTHFPPGMPEREAERLHREIADAAQLYTSDDGIAPVASIAAEVARGTGASLAQVLAAISQMRKSRAVQVTSMVEGRDLATIARGEKHSLTLPGSKGLHDAFLYDDNGRPAVNLMLPRQNMSVQDIIDVYQKNKDGVK